MPFSPFALSVAVPTAESKSVVVVILRLRWRYAQDERDTQISYMSQDFYFATTVAAESLTSTG